MATFEIYRDQEGMWRVRRADGLVEGRFRDRLGAVRFVRQLFPGNSAVIVFQRAARH